jgi:hypothetical protein
VTESNLENVSTGTSYGSRLSTAIFVLLVAISVYLLMLGSIVIYLAVHIDDSTNAIKDCTVATGKCFKDANKRTGGAVHTIAAYNVASVACAQSNKGYAEIQKCVRDTLTALQNQTQPNE